MVGADLLARRQGHTADVACALRALDAHIADVLLEADLTAQRLDVRAHLLDHADQAEGADVGLGHIEDFLRRTGLDELGQHLARQVARVGDLAPELAVRERARTAFTELDIRLGVEHALAPQAPGVFRSLAHFLAPLQHDGTQAHLGQNQRRENAARTEAHHQRTQAPFCMEIDRRMPHEVVTRVGRWAHMGVGCETLQHIDLQGLGGQFAVNGVDQDDGRFLARVMAALENGERMQVGVLQPQTGHDRRAHSALGMVQGQPQLGDSQHIDAVILRRNQLRAQPHRKASRPKEGLASSASHQPPLWQRLPGFFLLRVCEPRSRLRFWPLPRTRVTPAGATGRGVA